MQTDLEAPETEPRDVKAGVALAGVRKAFGPVVALDGVDLRVVGGEVIAVVGPSGCGKSTLLELVCGLLAPDAGTVAAPPAALMPQRDGLLPWLSALDNAALARRVAGDGKAAARAAAHAHFAAFGLEGFEHARPAELSGGMQKRVALARAIASEPAIMFFDEPTTGLDPIMGAVIDGLIVDCVKRLGSTAIAITHDMVSTMRIGDRAAMLRNGRIIWEGPAAEVMTSGDPVVDQFTHGRREGPIQMELRR